MIRRNTTFGVNINSKVNIYKSLLIPTHVFTIFSETSEDVSFTKALEKWLSLTNEQESPLDGTQKNWTQAVNVKTAKSWILEWMTNFRKFLTHQRKFESQWLNVVPCKNLGLKLDDQQIGFQLNCVSEPTSVKELNGTNAGHFA